MKGAMFIMILLAMLVGGYVVYQDIQAKQEEGSHEIEVFKKADQLGEKVNKSSQEQEERLKKILGE